jgi:hypothetical protein
MLKYLLSCPDGFRVVVASVGALIDTIVVLKLKDEDWFKGTDSGVVVFINACVFLVVSTFADLKCTVCDK